MLFQTVFREYRTVASVRTHDLKESGDICARYKNMLKSFQIDTKDLHLYKAMKVLLNSLVREDSG